MTCEQALNWLQARLDGDLRDAKQMLSSQHHSDYWRGRVASLEDAMGTIDGVRRRLMIDG